MKFFPYSLLLSICFCIVSAADATTPYRIMPIGDSITEGGKTFVVYRPVLWEKLHAAGYAFRFVGSKKSDSPHGALNHEGYGGRNAEFLAITVPKNFKDHPADIVLIHAGHNHTSEEQPVGTIIASTEKLITSLRALNPNVKVLLAQVITSGKLPKYSYLPALNEELAKLALKLNTPEQRIILVNQAEGFDPATDAIADKVHPNAAGAEKMAAKWFDALTSIMEKAK
ncbi:MAG: GDSL-type esterase/lipase family protein [Planctomycetota bacterium]